MHCVCYALDVCFPWWIVAFYGSSGFVGIRALLARETACVCIFGCLVLMLEFEFGGL